MAKSRFLKASSKSISLLRIGIYIRLSKLMSDMVRFCMEIPLSESTVDIGVARKLSAAQ